VQVQLSEGQEGLYQNHEWHAGHREETWGKVSCCSFSVKFCLGLEINDCNIKNKPPLANKQQEVVLLTKDEIWSKVSSQE